MGHGNWVVMVLVNDSDEEISIGETQLMSGRFFDPRHDYESQVSRIHGCKIQAHSALTVGACGEAAHSGTEGKFNILTKDHEPITSVYWNDPFSGFGMARKTFELKGTAKSWKVTARNISERRPVLPTRSSSSSSSSSGEYSRPLRVVHMDWDEGMTLGRIEIRITKK